MTDTNAELELGLRVKGAVLKETDDGGVVADITVVGVARGMVKLVGQDVRIETAGRGRFRPGHLRQVTITEGKDGKRRTVKMRVTGGRDLDQMIGLQVTVERAQMELPGVPVGAEE